MNEYRAGRAFQAGDGLRSFMDYISDQRQRPEDIVILVTIIEISTKTHIDNMYILSYSVRTITSTLTARSCYRICADFMFKYQKIFLSWIPLTSCGMFNNTVRFLRYQRPEFQ